MLGTAASYNKYIPIMPSQSEATVWEVKHTNINSDILSATNIFLPKSMSVYLGTLSNKNYALKKYIEIKIKIDLADVIGEISELGIYAFGNNIEEVVGEIEEDIIELYEELLDLGNYKLGTLPKKWKRFLKSNIKKG